MSSTSEGMLFFLSQPGLSSDQLGVFLPLPLFSHVTNAHTQRAAISDASPFSPPLIPPVALFKPHLLCIRPILLAVVTGRLWWRGRWKGLLEEGWGFGFGHFVKEGKIGYIFSWRRQGDDGRKLVSPEYLIWKVGCSNLAGGGGRLNRGAHDYQEFKVSQLRVCPATTWRKEETLGWKQSKRTTLFRSKPYFVLFLFPQ